MSTFDTFLIKIRPSYIFMITFRSDLTVGGESNYVYYAECREVNRVKNFTGVEGVERVSGNGRRRMDVQLIFPGEDSSLGLPQLHQALLFPNQCLHRSQMDGEKRTKVSH